MISSSRSVSSRAGGRAMLKRSFRQLARQSHEIWFFSSGFIVVKLVKMSSRDLDGFLENRVSR